MLRGRPRRGRRPRCATAPGTWRHSEGLEGCGEAGAAAQGPAPGGCSCESTGDVIHTHCARRDSSTSVAPPEAHGAAVTAGLGVGLQSWPAGSGSRSWALPCGDSLQPRSPALPCCAPPRPEPCTQAPVPSTPGSPAYPSWHLRCFIQGWRVMASSESPLRRVG